MGNCIIRQSKVMQTGWDVTEQKERMKVHRVLPEVLPVVQHLRQETHMISGQMYHPVPLSVPLLEFNKNPVMEAESQSNHEVVRIKLVITKQELEVMLRKGGVSVSELVSHTNKESLDETDGRWKPVLDSIPEFN
ncbi:uncharacterized protein LOC112507739 [Cynara cardunculus var. scolymus]|uniref:Uncharacterized protein n=1 Tax=Cynara cardunculus var. scolymus TaxID=59895 RepID=A0A118K7C3_CYNCS|nr:uncharacterized protein LOC112507739 [Cynara cardunculus var. scolymus]KVI12002.1 Protein of unknown function DUF4228 [Cynara cardunculus var. scolymus]